jgi:phage recombination protein Bet
MAQATTRTPTQQTPQPATSKGQVAVLAPARLMMPEQSILQEYDVDPQGWRVLVESIFPAAKTPMAVMMALDYCKRRKLDVYKHPVHIVPIWNSSAGENGKGAMVETIWPGINELRTTAMRTGEYAGMDVPTFGPLVTHKFEGRIKKWANGGASWEKVEATVSFPEWCQITVYRALGGNRVPFPGPRVYWLETYARLRNDVDVPNSMWEKRANGQIEKCAEAAALRRAFPEEIGSDYSIDEIGAFTTHAPTDITEQGSAALEPAPAEPKRENYQSPSSPAPTPHSAAGDEGGQPGVRSSPGAGGDSTPDPQGEPEAASTPAQNTGTPPAEEKPPVTDVQDLNDGGPTPPVADDPSVEFARFGKTSAFLEAFEDWIKDPRNGPKNGGRWLAYYEKAIKACESSANKDTREYITTLVTMQNQIIAGQEPTP